MRHHIPYRYRQHILHYISCTSMCNDRNEIEIQQIRHELNAVLIPATWFHSHWYERHGYLCAVRVCQIRPLWSSSSCATNTIHSIHSIISTRCTTTIYKMHVITWAFSGHYSCFAFRIVDNDRTTGQIQKHDNLKYRLVLHYIFYYMYAQLTMKGWFRAR